VCLNSAKTTDSVPYESTPDFGLVSQSQLCLTVSLIWVTVSVQSRSNVTVITRNVTRNYPNNITRKLRAFFTTKKVRFLLYTNLFCGPLKLNINTRRVMHRWCTIQGVDRSRTRSN